MGAGQDDLIRRQLFLNKNTEPPFAFILLTHHASNSKIREKEAPVRRD
jgi:hypothetical protein